MSNSTVEPSAPVREFTDSRSPSPDAAPPRSQSGAPSASVRRASSLDGGTNEFNYRPVPVIAPVAFFLGICSIIGLFGLIGLGVGVVGTILGIVALLHIRRAPDEWSGQWMAASGIGLSLFFLVSGSVMHGVAYATEVPEGVERVNFTRDISKKGFLIEDGAPAIHPDVRKLDGKKVFLKGYMYPERQTEEITRFVFVKDNGQCCFGGQPQMTDMILIEMDPGKKVEFLPYLVSVAGVFHARAPDTAGGLTTVYKLEASYFSPAKTSF